MKRIKKGRLTGARVVASDQKEKKGINP